MIRQLNGVARASLVVGAALVLGVVAVSAAAAQGAPPSVRIGFVNSNALIMGAPGRAEAQQIYDREKVTFEAEVARMSDSLRAMDNKLKADAASLSPATLAARQQELEDRFDAYSRRGDSLRALSERRQNELLQPVIDLVNRVLQEIRTEDNYSVIFDLSADGQPVVAFDKNLDITDRVLARVRQQPTPTLPAGRTATPPVRPPPPSPQP